MKEQMKTILAYSIIGVFSIIMFIVMMGQVNEVIKNFVVTILVLITIISFLIALIWALHYLIDRWYDRIHGQ